MISLTEFYLSDKSKQAQMIIDSNSEIIRLKEEIEKLTDESTKWESKFYDEAKKVDKATEYIKENETTFSVHQVANAFGIPSLEFTLEPWKKDLLNILQGVDKK